MTTSSLLNGYTNLQGARQRHVPVQKADNNKITEYHTAKKKKGKSFFLFRSAFETCVRCLIWLSGFSRVVSSKCSNVSLYIEVDIFKVN
jgi:hypothetical protein